MPERCFARVGGWKARGIAIFLNGWIPYIGTFLIRPARMSVPLILSAFLVTLLMVTNDNVIGGLVLLRHSEFILLGLLILLFVHSSYLSVVASDAMSISFKRLALPAICVIACGAIYLSYEVRSLRIASNSLQPLLPPHAIIAAARTPSVDLGTIAVVYDDVRRSLRAGIVLAVEGDRLGLDAQAPVACRTLSGKDICRRLDEICSRNTPNGNLVESRSVLSKEQILLTTTMQPADLRILSQVISYSALYRVTRAFTSDRWLDFGYAPEVSCRSAGKQYLLHLAGSAP